MSSAMTSTQAEPEPEPEPYPTSESEPIPLSEVPSMEPEPYPTAEFFTLQPEPESTAQQWLPSDNFFSKPEPYPTSESEPIPASEIPSIGPEPENTAQQWFQSDTYFNESGPEWSAEPFFSPEVALSEPEAGTVVEPMSEPMASSEDMKWLVVALYSIYIVLIISGNLLIIVTVIKNKVMHTSGGFFIVSLSMAYICVGLFVLPIEITARFPEAWLPVWACKLCHFTALTSTTAAVLTLIIASIVRYRSIVYNSLPHLSRQKVMKVTGGIWLTGMLYGLRMPIYSDMMTNMCTMMINASLAVKELFVLFDLFLMFVIPLILVFTLNLVLIGYLNYEIVEHPEQEVIAIANQKKMRMLVILVCIFFVTRLPLFLSQAINTFHPSVKISFACFIMLKLLAFTSAWTHVLIFFSYNEKANACLRLMLNRPKIKDAASKPANKHLTK